MPPASCSALPSSRPLQNGGKQPSSLPLHQPTALARAVVWPSRCRSRSNSGAIAGAATPSCFPVFCLAGSLALPLTRWFWCCASLCGFAQRRTGAAVCQPKGTQHLTPGTARGHSSVHPRCAHTPQGAQLRAAARACMIAVLFASARVAQSTWGAFAGLTAVRSLAGGAHKRTT